jgi:hypothetical protein
MNPTTNQEVISANHRDRDDHPETRDPGKTLSEKVIEEQQ